LTELGPSDKVMPECFNVIDPPAPITQAREKQMRADRDKAGRKPHRRRRPSVTGPLGGVEQEGEDRAGVEAVKAGRPPRSR